MARDTGHHPQSPRAPPAARASGVQEAGLWPPQEVPDPSYNPGPHSQGLIRNRQLPSLLSCSPARPMGRPAARQPPLSPLGTAEAPVPPSESTAWSQQAATTGQPGRTRWHKVKLMQVTAKLDLGPRPYQPETTLSKEFPTEPCPRCGSGPYWTNSCPLELPRADPGTPSAPSCQSHIGCFHTCRKVPVHPGPPHTPLPSPPPVRNP